MRPIRLETPCEVAIELICEREYWEFLVGARIIEVLSAKNSSKCNEMTTQAPRYVLVQNIDGKGTSAASAEPQSALAFCEGFMCART